ncbi:membrane-bound inhibitor of C-type lysozyme [Psychrobacter immobilis]|uniref:Membrane-bound inhibitor of C-type lysozyme n=1 Tax=Psychrobacter immobilis TaxID=498 RepID=A0A2V2A4X4_PSYIM|nr:MliC family protein [Psychrobacter immobilis]PWK14670.1 membrane-bound inhibitor of C-type lysozyme [Psychrobacter immobilis]
MKKLLAVAPFALLLSACATNSPTTTTPETNTQPVVQSFTCEDNGQLTAAYTANGQTANLNVTLPKVGLTNAKITMEQAVSGSGARYVNNVNPKTTYDWHTKADYGIMTIKSDNGQQYQVNCQL